MLRKKGPAILAALAAIGLLCLLIYGFFHAVDDYARQFGPYGG